MLEWLDTTPRIASEPVRIRSPLWLDVNELEPVFGDYVSAFGIELEGG